MITYTYKNGGIPSDLRKTSIITIPRSARVDKYEIFKTISLLSHASKILTRIFYKRIACNIERSKAKEESVLVLKKSKKLF